MSLADALAELLGARCAGGRLLVAVDGPDAAGKTTLARAVAERLVRPSLCVSIDGWHHPLRSPAAPGSGVRGGPLPRLLRRRYARRYLPGQALYREVAAPLDAADVLVDNTDPEQPRVLRWPER